MDWTDQPAQPPAPQPPAGTWGTPPQAAGPDTAGLPPTKGEPRRSFFGLKRTAATALLAVGLLAVGGVAAVSAADPSGSPAPGASSQPADGGSTAPGTGGTQQPAAPDNGTAPNRQGPGARAGHDCPNMGNSGSGGTQTPGSSAPTTPSDGTTTPSASDL
jgi:hypothetical protein